MKKSLKITLIVLGVLVGVIIFDTLQAKIFDNSPLLKIRDNLDGGSTDYIDKGLFVNHYHCNNNEKVTTWKGTKFACPMSEKNEGKQENDEHSFYGKIVESHETYIIVEPNEDEEERKSSDKFRIDLGKNNDAIYVVGSNVKITYVGGINESYPAQIGTTNIEVVKDFDFYITKPQAHNDIRFNDYLTFSDRKIYLAGNIGEFYVVDGKTMILKEYISNANRTMDDSIKSITDKLELKDTLKDGGTKIYKSKDKDITMIVCNTTKNDRNILIGDYSMEYTEGDCKN